MICKKSEKFIIGKKLPMNFFNVGGRYLQRKCPPVPNRHTPFARRLVSHFYTNLQGKTHTETCAAPFRATRRSPLKCRADLPCRLSVS